MQDYNVIMDQDQDKYKEIQKVKEDPRSFMINTPLMVSADIASMKSFGV